jgi:riboflavin kinase/FMN adenylyltransferase
MWMEVIEGLNHCLAAPPGALTIGNFDGVHLGHQYLFSQLRQAAQTNRAQTTVLTFLNHPHEILKPDFTLARICSLEQKIQLIEAQGIDRLVLVKFTPEFSNQTPEQFVNLLQRYVPFHTLILGANAVFGKNREGRREKIEQLATQMHFKVTYLEKLHVEGLPVSSSVIRQFIQSGNLQQASEMLGRRYSIYRPVVPGKKIGQTLGFPTLNIDIQGLCLPPQGVYAVKLKQNGVLYPAVANLGIAPTVRQDKRLTLELHVMENKIVDVTRFVEVIFFEYIRPERQFESIEDLKRQIRQDIISSKLKLP